MTAPIARTESAAESVAITPHDTNTIRATRAIYVGVAGDITLQHEAGTNVLYSNVPVGVLPVTAVRVMSTATTATNMVAMY